MTDWRSLPGGEKEFLNCIEQAAAAGVDWIQIREKDLDGARMSELTREAMRRIAVVRPRGGTCVLVNDRLDVAIATGAGGVHLGENSLTAEDVLRCVQSPEGRSAAKDFLVGVSCHSPASAREAEEAGASYIFFGPVFATPSKAEFGVPQGIERLAEVCRSVKIPVLAIGGISGENAGACLVAGAAGIAAIRLFQEAKDLASAVEALRAIS